MRVAGRMGAAPREHPGNVAREAMHPLWETVGDYMATGGVKPNGKSLPDHLTPGNPGNSGGKAGRSGRKPNAFILTCAQLTDDVVLPKVQKYLASHDCDDAGFRWASDWLRDYGMGKAPQVIEHTGKDGGPIEHIEHAKADFDGRIARLAERLGSAAMSEGID